MFIYLHTGSYFGPYFYLGGKKFEVAQPEAFLFGDNTDLNYLGPQPHSLPYQCPAPDKPVRALKCLINIRKDSLRLIRYVRWMIADVYEFFS